MSDRPDGWYPDPEDAAQMRWLEAGAWTRHVLPARTIAAPAETEPMIPESAGKKAAEPKLELLKTKTLRQGVGPSTWIVGMPLLIAVVVFGASNPSLTALAVGIIVALTALYAMIAGRPSWARISSRQGAVIPMALAAVMMVGAPVLPTNPVVAPKFITELPVPDETQQSALLRGLQRIDQRTVLEWEPEKAVNLAYGVCRDDFAAQTPEQAINNIQDRLVFDTDPSTLTGEQALAVLNTVRETFCGQPGSRDTVAESEFVYGIPAILALIGDTLLGKK